MKLFFIPPIFNCFYSVIRCRGISKLRIYFLCLYLYHSMENNRESRLRVSVESRGAGWRTTAQEEWWRCAREHNPKHRLQLSPLVLQQLGPWGNSWGFGLQMVAELLSKARAGDCGLTFGRRALVEAHTWQMKELPGGRARGTEWGADRDRDGGGWRTVGQPAKTPGKRWSGKSASQRLLVKPCLTGGLSSDTKRKRQVGEHQDALHNVVHYWRTKGTIPLSEALLGSWFLCSVLGSPIHNTYCPTEASPAGVCSVWSMRRVWGSEACSVKGDLIAVFNYPEGDCREGWDRLFWLQIMCWNKGNSDQVQGKKKIIISVDMPRNAVNSTTSNIFKTQ